MQTDSERLGMNYATASYQLRQTIIYDLANRLGLLVCAQCNAAITDQAQFSIEHQEPWRKAEHPKAVFFNLNNIAFSHIDCNRQKSTGSEVHRNKTECPRGHPYDMKNTYVYKGHRSCRTCHRERQRK